MAVGVMLVAPAVASGKGVDVYKQAGVRHGGHRIPARQVATHFALTRGVSNAHCYGYDRWKKGVNTATMIIWTEHNRTFWCGVPGSHILKGSVSGQIRTWTGPLWEVHDKSWTSHRDPLHPQNEAHTMASATFGEGADGFDVFSETVSVGMRIYADGKVRS